MTHPSINNLFPAIAESFAVIFIGYLFGRFKLINPSEARSITALVGRLALPALLFRNLATLDLGFVSWRFLACILIAKSLVFIITAILTFVISRPWHIGKAGLYGIFATQSNDFALGLPIVQALYGTNSTSPESFYYASYLYLLAPISLLIINPIGFFMMEYSKQSRMIQFTNRQIPKLILKTFLYVALNPVVFMTVFGIIVNVINTYGIHHGDMAELPHWLTHFLDLLGGAYAPCALFNIGLFMVGKIQKVTGMMLLVSSLLIFAKSIFLPMIGYVFVRLIIPGGTMNASVDSLSSFGFLYCTFPTAPTVFIYASQYTITVSVIASSIVFGTIFSAPLMYVSARMVVVQFAAKHTYEYVIMATKLNAGSISMLSLSWVFILFLFSKRYRSYPHIVLMHFMIAQFVECLGGVVLAKIGSNSYWAYLLFSLFFVGVFASRLWTVSLTIVLYLLTTRRIVSANRAWFPLLLSSWGIPVVITVLMVVLSTASPLSSHDAIIDLSFLFGKVQLIVSILFLLPTVIIGVICVILIVIQSKKHLTPESEPLVQQKGTPLSYNGVSTEDNNTHPSQTDSILNVHPYDSSSSSNHRSKITETCIDHSDELLVSQSVRSFGQIPNVGTWERDLAGKSLTKFIVLVLFLLFSCIVGVLTVLWKLSTKDTTGIFVAIAVLDNIMNFGQGFFVFVVFGFEKHWFWLAIYERIRYILFKIETVTVPEKNELSSAVLTVCSIFRTQHLQSCKEDIVSDKRYHLQVYSDVFSGIAFIDWLLNKGLVNTREEGVQYGNTLLEGRVLSHVLNEHYFHDEGYFYQFLQ